MLFIRQVDDHPSWSTFALVSRLTQGNLGEELTYGYFPGRTIVADLSLFCTSYCSQEMTVPNRLCLEPLFASALLRWQFILTGLTFRTRYCGNLGYEYDRLWCAVVEN